MLTNILSYVKQTISDEFSGNLVKAKESLLFEFTRVRNGLKTRRLKKELKKKMKRAKNREEWKIYAEEFDNLEGDQYILFSQYIIL